MPEKEKTFTYQHYQRHRRIYLIPINIMLPSRGSTPPNYCQLINYLLNFLALELFF